MWIAIIFMFPFPSIDYRTPRCVRVKERSQFTYKGQWSFDCTRVRQAGSDYELGRQDEEARLRGKNIKWTYELEVEVCLHFVKADRKKPF